MNLQNVSDKYAQKFLDMAEEKGIDSSVVPQAAIAKYARMLVVYCDAEGKVSQSFQKSMEKCAEEIVSVEGMEQIFEVCNTCPED